MNNPYRIAVPLLAAAVLVACAGNRPDGLAPADGRLMACPDSPNCVSSQAADAEHAIEPFHYEGSRRAAMERLRRVLAGFERTTIVDGGDTWIHAECRSAIMGFVDDVVFSFAEPGLVHVRSASRLGYSDLGVNRERVTRLRHLFDKTK